jgi:hypothetical protein
MTVSFFVGIDEMISQKALKYRYIMLAIVATLAVFIISYRMLLWLPLLILNLSIPLLIWLGYIYIDPDKNQQIKPLNKKILLSAIIIILLFSVLMCKLFRADVIGQERFLYKAYYDNQSVFNTLKTNNANPFRTGTIGKIFLPSIQAYGIETIDGKSVLFSKYYKQYFRLIIAPQLKTKYQQDKFDTYWYHLYLDNDDDNIDGITELNIPLLELANTKYLVSHVYDPKLAEVSKNVIKAKNDDERMPVIYRIYNNLYKRTGLITDREIRYFPIYIYELKDTVERGYLSANATIEPTDEKVLEALNTLSTAGLQNLKDTVIFSSKDAPDANTVLSYKDISNTLFKQNSIKMLQRLMGQSIKAEI